jgi:hypothetical protein
MAVKIRPGAYPLVIAILVFLVIMIILMFCNQPVKPDCLCGDVDDNGKVQAYDAALVLQHVKKMIVLEDSLCGDVDMDGVLTEYDAELIREHVVELPHTIPTCWDEE